MQISDMSVIDKHTGHMRIYSPLELRNKARAAVPKAVGKIQQYWVHFDARDGTATLVVQHEQLGGWSTNAQIDL